MPFYVRFIEAESRRMVARGGVGELVFNEHSVSVWEDYQELWRRMVVMVGQQGKCP